MKKIAGACALLLALTAGAATAQGGANGADARCLAAMSLMHDEAGAGDKGAFESGMMYFLGKIVGRGGTRAVGPAIEAGAVGLDKSSAADVASTCADEMTRASDAM